MDDDVEQTHVSRIKQLLDELCEEHERMRLDRLYLREEVRRLRIEVQQKQRNGIHDEHYDTCSESESEAEVANTGPEEPRDTVPRERVSLQDNEEMVQTTPKSAKLFWKELSECPSAANGARAPSLEDAAGSCAVDSDHNRQPVTLEEYADSLRPQVSESESANIVSKGRKSVIHSQSGTGEFSLYGGDEPDTDASSSFGEAAPMPSRPSYHKQLARSQTEELVSAHEFVIRPIWTRKRSSRKITNHSLSGTTPLNKRDAMNPLKDSLGHTPIQQRIYCDPSSRFRVIWDCIGLFSLMADLIFVPLEAFNVPRIESAEVLDWMTRIFWTVDIPASFLVGFYRQGELIMSPRRITKRYLMTWFIPDIIIVVSDWLLWWMAFSSGSKSSSYVRMARVARTARLVRLFRVLKLRRLMQGMEDLIDTEKIHICLACTKPVILILAFNHFLACAWFAVGRAGNPGWTKYFAVDEEDFAYEYLTSLHWSLSQFTVGNMDVQAVNTGERLFTVVVMVTGLSSFSSLLGSVTSAVERLRELRSDENRQFWLLRRYLRDYKISKNLMSRIHRYCDYAYKHRQSKMQKQRVQLLDLLSDQLHWELQSEIHTPHLRHHPLFDKIVSLPCKNHMDRVCAQALSSVEVARSEALFLAGDPCAQMLFIVDGEGIYIKAVHVEHGEMSYVVSPYVPLSGAYSTNIAIGVGDWACEQVLYTPWVHLGELRAAHESRLLSLDANRFCEVLLTSHPMLWELCRCYAVQLLSILNKFDAQDLTDLLQLLIPPMTILEEQDEEVLQTSEGQFGAWGIAESVADSVADTMGRIFSRRPSDSSTRSGGQREDEFPASFGQRA